MAAEPPAAPSAPAPPRPPGADRRARARGRQLRVLLARVDVLVDRRADDLPAGLRVRLRLAGLVGRRPGLRPVRRAPGTVATAVLFSSVFPAMFGTFVKYASSSGPTTRSSPRRSTPRSSSPPRRCGSPRAPASSAACRMLVAMVFGLDPSWGMLLVPFIALHRRLRLGVVRGADRGGPEVDRQLQLRHLARSSRRCSSWPARSSRSPACPSGRRSLAQRQPALPLRPARPPRRLRAGPTTSGTSASWSPSASSPGAWRSTAWSAGSSPEPGPRPA